MSRTMSGIPTSGAGGGDALLAGGTLAAPQNFTGFNEFDELTQFKTKRPELSDAGGATFPPTDDEFITKLDGVDLFGSLSGSAQLNGGGNTAEDPPQTFTGFNEFDEKVVIKGENIDFTNATRRVIDMTIAPLASNSNKLIMEAPTTEITMTSGGSKNQFSQTAQSSAINSFLQTGTASTINLISQVGANSTITTDGKFTTATAPSGVNDLCNKAYVDGFNEVGFEGNFNANPVVSYSVGQGNPTTASGGDSLNGRMDTPQGFLNADITIPATGGAVKIDICITGEWSNISWDKGVILARAEADPDGTFPNPVVYQALIRANLDTTSPNSGRYIIPFLATFGAGQDNGSTLESATGFVIDTGTGVVIGKTYRYTPVLINTSVTHTFKLNRVINSTNNVGEERTVSSICASILKV